MVRTCQAEPSVADYFDPLIRQRLTAQVGLLVGKRNVGSRDLLLTVVRTPLRDGLDAAQCSSSGAGSSSSKPGGSKTKAGASGSGSGSGSGAALLIDTDWVSEHAAQLSHMLPGGLCVLGMYIFCPDSVLTSALDQLSKCVIAQQHTGSAAKDPSPEPPDSVLLLHVDSTTKKLSLRARDLPPPGASSSRPTKPVPVELKLSPFISSLCCITCSHHVDMAFSVTAGKDELKECVAAAVEAECSRISESMVVVPNGGAATAAAAAVPAMSSLVADALALPGAEAKKQLGLASASVCMLTPLPCGGWGVGPGVGVVAVQGRVSLQGLVHAVAYVHKRETFGRAVAELKADIQSSLHRRLELLLEDAYSWEEEQQELAAAAGPGGETKAEAPAAGGGGHTHPLLRRGVLDKGSRLVLPRRVLLPWEATGLQLYDYLLPGEDAEAASDRASELLGVRLQLAAAQAEAAAPLGGAPAPWRPLPAAAGAAAAGRSGAATPRAAKGQVAGAEAEGQAGKAADGGGGCSWVLAAAAVSAGVALLAVGFSWVGVGQ